MRRFVLALSLLISFLFPTASHAEWVKVAKNVIATFYLDTKVRKDSEHIYYWVLLDYLKPTKYGTLSTKIYYEADCGKFRTRRLQASFHTESMGRGTPAESSGPVTDDPWKYPAPNTAGEGILETTCELAKMQ